MKPRLTLPLVFSSIGAFTLASQTLLLREYLVSFQGNELTIAVFYGSWLLWIGVGSLLAMALRRRLHTGRLFLPLVGLYPILVAAQLILITIIRPLAGVEPFELFPLGTLLVATVLTNCPVSSLTGFLFTTGCLFSAAAARSREQPGSTGEGHPPESPAGPEGQSQDGDGVEGARSGTIAARLYAYEALGSFAGGLLVTLLLWKLVAPLTVLLIVSAGLAVGLLVAGLAHRLRESAVLGGLLLVAALASWWTPLGGRARAWLDALRWEVTLPTADLITTVETPYQRVSIGRLANQTVFLTDGSIVTSTADTLDQQLAAALLLAEAPRAANILVLGIGVEGLVPHLLRYGVDRIDLVQVDRRYHESALPHYDRAVQAAFRDPRVTAYFGDPRDFLVSREKRGQILRYDLVLIDLPDPDTAYLNRFYTVDFYRTVREVLSDRGMVATQVSAGENYAGTELMEYGRSVYRSLEEVFDQVVVTPGERAWLFASPEADALTLDAVELEQRFERLGERDDTVPTEVFLSLVPPERIESTRRQFIEVRDEFRSSLLNTDVQPVTLFLNLLVLSMRSGMKVGQTLRAFRAVGLPLMILPLLLFALLRLYYRSTTRKSREQAVAFNGTAMLAGFGATSMCLSILLLIAFQNRFGYLFLSVGLLSALFMFGLFLGGLLGIRLFRDLRDTRFWPAHLVIGLVIGLTLVLPMVVEELAGTPRGIALAVYHGLFLLTGTSCGLAFPSAGYYLNRSSRDTGLVAGLLESFDHWGGALGAAIIGVLILPVLGMARASLLLALLLGTIWVLFAAEQLGGHASFREASWVRPIRKRFERIERCHRHHRHRALALLAVGSALVVVLWSNLLSARRAELDELAQQQWVENPFRSVPGSPQEVQREETPFVHYISQDPENPERYEIIVESRTIAPDVRGFSGPINLMVSVGNEGEFHRIALLEHRETPAYIQEIDPFLARFEGLPLDRPIELGIGGVDAMTGATISSRAIAAIAEQCRQRIATDLLSREVGETTPGAAPVAFDHRVAYVLAMLLLGVVVFLKAGKVVRLVYLGANLVLAGFWLNIQFSLWHVTHLLSFHFPSLHTLEMFLLMAGLLLVAVAFGQVHCGVLCPFGALQELLGRVGLARQASHEADRRSRTVKYAVLTAVLVAFFSSRSDSLLSFDPLQIAFTFDYAPLMVVLLVIILAFCLLYFRFWCRYLCPVGAFWSLFNKLNWLKRWIRPKRYNRCDLGVENRFDMDCIQCNRCLDGSLEAPVKRTAGSIRDVRRIEGCNAAVGADPRPSGRFRDRLLYSGVALALVVSVLLLAGVGKGQPAGESPAPHETVETAPGGGSPRAIDSGLFQRLIEQGELSDHEALFYRRLVEEPSQ